MKQVSPAQRRPAEEDHIARKLFGDGGQHVRDRVITPNLRIRDTEPGSLTRQVFHREPDGSIRPIRHPEASSLSTRSSARLSR